MTQSLHIFRKDLRRLRWWLALWGVLLAARVLLATIWTLNASDDLGEQLLFDYVTGALGIATYVLFGILVARLVHDEPLVGLDWFWLTRPYDRRSLLAAKLGFAVLLFVVLPLAAELVVMAAYGATPWDMARASSSFVARDGSWTAGLMVFAVLTSTLAGFALGLAATAAAFGVAVLGALAVAMLWVEQETGPSATMPDASHPVIATVVFLFACLAVIVYQYHRRRRGPALVVATLGLAAVGFVPAIWPWRIVPPAVPIEPAAVARETAETIIQVDRTAPPRIVEQSAWRRRDVRTLQISVPVAVSGLTPGYRARSILAESQLELPSGASLESRQTAGTGTLVFAGSAGEPTHELQGVLRGVRILPVHPQAVRPPHVTVLTVTDEQLAHYGSEPGRLVTTFHIPLQHSRIAGTLPLAEGARHRLADMQIELVRVDRRHDGCAILLRQWQARSLVSPPEFRQHTFLLRNAERQEAYAADVQRWTFGASSLFPLSLFGFTPDSGYEGFSVEHLWQDYPPRRGTVADRPAIDARWLAGADFVVVETVPAGVIRRTVVLDDFRMQEPAPEEVSAAR